MVSASVGRNSVVGEPLTLLLFLGLPVDNDIHALLLSLPVVSLPILLLLRTPLALGFDLAQVGALPRFLRGSARFSVLCRLRFHFDVFFAGGYLTCAGFVHSSVGRGRKQILCLLEVVPEPSVAGGIEISGILGIFGVEDV